MAKSETAQIAQLDERIKSLDANIKQLITDVDAFKDRLSKANSSGIEQMRKEYQSLQKKVEEVGMSQAKTAKNVEEQIQRVSRSRRVDNKILERQNQLLAAQKRLAATGDIGQRFSTLRNSIGGIDFNSILAKANAPTDKGFKMLHDSGSETAVRRFVSAQNEAKKSVEKTTSSIKAQKGSLESMLPTLRRLASAFGVAFSVQGLVNFGMKLVETRGEFELQQVALRSILQNKQLADEIWDKTMQAALQSPFTAMQLTRYTKQLAAYRIETDKLFDTTKRLADVSAGLGVDMQRLILAYGQVKAANYLRASEIRQFTEAGVNVLGELSNYFSETRGQMISTAQVMDMVQKRMVKFEDVEEIFKRLTDEGGIFYNMQYVQSQTVWGQLRKLRDAYDQMQNSIGKANEGVIKDFVSILNSAVQNWRGIAVTLKSIGWGVAIGWMSKYALSLSGITAASMKTKRSIVSLRQGIEGLGKALKANLPMLAIGAAVALITRFVESARQMRQVNDEIDEQITTLYGASQQMTDYQLTIEKNNELIKSNGKEITDNKKRQEALNEALNSNSGIYAKLKNEYPQIAEQLKQNANGTIENTDALKAYNEQLEREMTLLAMREQKANIGNLWGAFSDSATEDLQDALKNTTKVQTEIRNLQLRLKTDVAKMYASGNVDERQIALANEFLSIPTEGDMEEALKRANEIRQKYLKEYAQYVKGDIGRGGYKNLGELSVFGNDFDIQGLGHTLEEFRREMVNIGWIGDGENLGKLETDFVGVIENFADFAKSISDEYNDDVLAFIANNSDAIKKAVEGDADNGIEASPEIVKGIGDALIKAGYATTKEMQAVWNNLLNDRIVFTQKNEELNAIDAQIAAEEAKKIKNRNQQLLDDLRKQREDYIKSHGLDWFAGSSTTGGTGGSGGGGDKGKKSASKLISLIREMRAEYDKLSKSAYGYAKSEATVRESYRQSVKEILGKAGITDYDFTTNAGMIAALEKVKVYAQKLGPEAAAEVEKYIGQLKTEMTINAQVRIREDFGRQMEEAFGNYELTLDLQKLNLPSDVLSDLFDLDTVDLSDLRNRVAKYYKDQVAIGVDPTDLVKQVEGYYKKIDDMERKQQQQRIKDYAKYLEYEMSERAKIEMEYVRKVGEVMSNTAFKSEQKESIKKRLEEERDKAIAKQDWEDFKGSETYVQMMEDLEGHGVAALKAMRVELEKVRDNAENLSPRALKEVVNAIEKIRKIELQKQNPFKRLSEAQDDLKAAREEAEKAGIDTNMSRKELSDEEALTRTTLMEREKAFNVMQKQIGAQKELNDYEKDRIKLEKKFSTEKYGYDISKVATGSVDDTAESNTLYGKILAQEDKVKAKTDEIAANREQMLDAQKKLVAEQAKGDKADKGKIQLYSDQIEMLDNLYSGLKTELETLQAEKGQLEEILRLRISAAEAKLSAKDISDDEKKSLEKEISDLKEKLRLLGVIVDKTKEQDDAWKNIASKVSQVASELSNIYNSFKGMMDSFGSDTESGVWAYGDSAMTVVSAIGNVAGKLASGDWIGAAFAAVSGIMDSLASWNKASDAQLDDIIKKEQKRIENLQDAYARLEKQIERTWDSVSYMQTYNQQIQNLNEQYRALSAQIASEEAKKNTDEEKLRGYQNQQQQILDQLDEIKQKQIEVFGGVPEDSYRSVAEGFVDAWKSAFLETGDGLQGLQDHFDEFLQEWFVKQAVMAGASSLLKPVIDEINKAVDPNGEGNARVTYSELERVREVFGTQRELLDEFLTDMAGMYDLRGEGSLSGLAAGIQGMTEEQANILEAYWNSVRMYTARIDQNVAMIASALGVGGNSPSTNPQLQQLQLIAASVQATHQLLQSTSRSGHPMGGYGFKVFND